jgi:hypothetical protein
LAGVGIPDSFFESSLLPLLQPHHRESLLTGPHTGTFVRRGRSIRQMRPVCSSGEAGRFVIRGRFVRQMRPIDSSSEAGFLL